MGDEEPEFVWVRAELKSRDAEKVKVWIQTPWGHKALVIVHPSEVKPDKE